MSVDISKVMNDIIEIVDKYDKKKLADDENYQSQLINEIVDTIKDRYGINIKEDKEIKEKIIKMIDEYIDIFDSKQKAYKIVANSIYGVYGEKNSRHYNPFIAESITSCGSLLSRSVQNYINDVLRIPVIYGDTDSIFLVLDDIIPDDIKKKGDDEVRQWIYKYLKEELYPKVNEYVDKLVYEWFNVKEHVFEFKQEIIAKKAIFMKAKSKDKEEAKKRYILYIIDKEGAKTDELLFTGIEIKRSEYPDTTKEVLSKFIEKIMKEDEVDINILIEFKKDIIKWCKNKEIEKIALNKGFSKNLEEYKQFTYAEWGAKFYNEVISEIYNLPKIEAGTKTMLIFVKRWNKANDSKFKIYNEFINRYGKYLKALIIPHSVYDIIPKEFYDLIEIDENETIKKILIEPIEGLSITLNMNISNLLTKYSISKYLL